jgi:hypothetical protein
MSMLNIKFEEMTSVITVPTNMKHWFLAPMLWGTSIAEVASFLDSSKRANNSTPNLTRDQAAHGQPLLMAFLESQIKPLVALAKVGLVEEEVPFFVMYANKNIKATFVGQTSSLHYYYLAFIVLTNLAYLVAVNTSYGSSLGNKDPGIQALTTLDW